ncbi:zinc ribbon domain-containing protein [Natrinema altunense]|uniref:Zinc-ribbon domain-containing protein n=1 Tax=Natrinema altunense (strain JCM 12890 / CGMCC 1.3731 / AJ2) TaxID=1227494 RepID=L9ZHN7_NATA2|nr:zinc ribbon domain-containing protein [Natrinema altunense]ELY84678.1 hypothetical protein C485_15010 [Natrinema altunense JCM 12890]
MVRDSCPNCGTSLSPTANYCSECGDAVDDDSWGVSSTESSWGSDGSRGDSQTEYGSTRRTDRDTTMAAITHVLAIFTWAIGPLIVLIATDDPFVEENARNALNWQIAFTVYMLVSFILVFAVVGIVPVLLLPFVDLAFCAIAAVKAADGESWSYPATPAIV